MFAVDHTNVCLEDSDTPDANQEPLDTRYNLLTPLALFSVICLAFSPFTNKINNPMCSTLREKYRYLRVFGCANIFIYVGRMCAY